MRTATVERTTKETSVSATVNLDGTGIYDVDTGIGFLDHMMEQLSRHSLIDITLRAKGDTHIDFHHTVEDVGIVIGQAISDALGDLRGITRTVMQLSQWMKHARAVQLIFPAGLLLFLRLILAVINSVKWIRSFFLNGFVRLPKGLA